MNKNEIYKEILQFIRDGVYFVDTNRKITFWNDYAEEITGFSASEVLDSYCYNNILNHVDDAGIHLCKEGAPFTKLWRTASSVRPQCICTIKMVTESL